MALWRGLIVNLIELKQRGLIPSGARVVEIGEQQLGDDFIVADALLDDLYAVFDKPRIELGARSRPFWWSLGFEYVALDFDPAFVGDAFCGIADIVIHDGKIADQSAAFRFIHDLTKPGGAIFSAPSAYTNKAVLSPLLKDRT